MSASGNGRLEVTTREAEHDRREHFLDGREYRIERLEEVSAKRRERLEAELTERLERLERESGERIARLEKEPEVLIAKAEALRTQAAAELKEASNLTVRKLTPRECERLQGFPDDWTLEKAEVELVGNEWRATGKVVKQADGPRYKQLGNAVTVNVAAWFGGRLANVEEAESKLQGE
tara:strand:+ start:432 stop:965 length:534 start_codon:yes stop_codon:yes gene_type:complete